MKRLIMATCVMLLLAGTAWGTSYMGAIGKLFDNSGNLITNYGGLYGSEQWVDALLAWTVDNETSTDGYWTYDYTFTVPKKGISHAIIEVSDSFTVTSNIFPGTTGDYELGNYNENDQGNSNPGIPGNIHGLKWEDVNSSSSLTWHWTIVSDRMPMWGDFYAKDGKNGGNDVYAYNVKFGNDTATAIGSGNAGGWVLVPDTQSGGGNSGPGASVPEPATILMLGLGMFLLAGSGWRRRAGNNS